MVRDFPEDFRACVRFHGHVCPGLAIGYAAARAARSALGADRAPDEELVAIVENDSCAVDAIQALLGCTFGKGNLIFRDWGKQVFTIIDRGTGRALRVSFTGQIPGTEERRALRRKLDSGAGTDQDKNRLEELKLKAVWSLISADSEQFFTVTEVAVGMPPFARVVQTLPCDACGEWTVTSKLRSTGDRMVCNECFLSSHGSSHGSNPRDDS
jgi:formylmethanofuran dehydrogenase subunit E